MRECWAVLARAVLRYRPLFILPQVILFGLSIYYTVNNLEFDTSRNNLVGANKKYHQNFLRFKKEFPTQDDLVVVVESEDAEKNRQFVERLGARMEAETNIFRDVFYKGDLKMLGLKSAAVRSRKPTSEAEEDPRGLSAFPPAVQHATNLVSLFEMVNTQFRTAKPEENAENKSHGQGAARAAAHC